jgi:hypothetical protein
MPQIIQTTCDCGSNLRALDGTIARCDSCGGCYALTRMRLPFVTQMLASNGPDEAAAG